jgi:hypothetical protein
VLSQLQRTYGGRPRLVVERGSRFLDWREFAECNDGGFPAIDVGQDGDCRWAADGQAGLHAHRFSDHFAFHRDEYDVKRYPVQHAVADTQVVAGALLGALVGGLLGGWRGAAAGAAGGGAVGAHVPRGVPSFWRIAYLHGNGEWGVERVAGPAALVPVRV